LTADGKLHLVKESGQSLPVSQPHFFFLGDIPMQRTFLLSTLLVLSLGSARFAAAHCQVPCGIFTDQLRFEQMLENTTTIAKAITELNNMAGKGDALSINQMVRWVDTKEHHATDTQDIIATYFMAQRIKSDSPQYVKQLTAAHAVMVAAMKCKQSTDAATAETLRKTIFDLYRAYTGKEPQFEAVK
jgi:nickel superoxide dismutase